jgi:hypothetical protein
VPRRRTGIIVIAVLLAASGLSFLRAEQVKLERSPVGGTKLQKSFSTTCPIHHKTRCTSHSALLRFRLRKPATVALTIVTSSGDVIRRLTPAAGERLPRGPVKLRWNGRTDGRTTATPGTYHLRVDLLSLGQVITIPDPIELDNTLPTLTLLGRRGELPLRYRTSEPAVVYVIARAAGRAALYRGRGGRVHFRHTRLSGSEAQITLTAVDRAGNRSRPVAAGSFHLPA